MLSRTQKPLVISPNYRLAIKRKNENFSIEQPSQIGGEKPVKTKKLRILNEFRKKVDFFQYKSKLLFLGRKLEF